MSQLLILIFSFSKEKDQAFHFFCSITKSVFILNPKLFKDQSTNILMLLQNIKTFLIHQKCNNMQPKKRCNGFNFSATRVSIFLKNSKKEYENVFLGYDNLQHVFQASSFTNGFQVEIFIIKRKQRISKDVTQPSEIHLCLNVFVFIEFKSIN